MITDNSPFVVFCKLDLWVEGKTSSGATDRNYVSEKSFGYKGKQPISQVFHFFKHLVFQASHFLSILFFIFSIFQASYFSSIKI